LDSLSRHFDEYWSSEVRGTEVLGAKCPHSKNGVSLRECCDEDTIPGLPAPEEVVQWWETLPPPPKGDGGGVDYTDRVDNEWETARDGLA
jgi:hypothetical protein